MAKYRTVFVCGHFVEIPIQEPGYRMLEAIVRFPNILPVSDKYWQVRPEKDADPVNAVLFDVEAQTFGSRTPWDGRLIGHAGKWVNEAARELARLIRGEI